MACATTPRLQAFPSEAVIVCSTQPAWTKETRMVKEPETRRKDITRHGGTPLSVLRTTGMPTWLAERSPPACAQGGCLKSPRRPCRACALAQLATTQEVASDTAEKKRKEAADEVAAIKASVAEIEASFAKMSRRAYGMATHVTKMRRSLADPEVGYVMMKSKAKQGRRHLKALPVEAGRSPDAKAGKQPKSSLG
mmetsp:Transcript_19302/g.30820  ORF Transcript_19302/g.30820 Transcript_19302/m.30820 type:complete len:195 (+) Transcript_19302:86-670(+)